jgi:hypothetical protein
LLLDELDAEPMRMVHPWMPGYLEVSVGRLFIEWSRQVDRDIAAGLPGPAPSRHMPAVIQKYSRWYIKVDAYLGQYQYELVEIVDWLLLAGGARHPWLENVDEKNRPKKLMKCRTVQALYDESVKCMRGRQSARKSAKDLTDADERHVVDLGAGYTVVELLTPDALDVESTRMRHCIGHGAYDGKLGHPGFHFFSIRDRGQPSATVELTPKLVDGEFRSVVRQFQGPRNAAPEPFLVELFNAALDDIVTAEMPASAPAPTRSVGRL